MPEKMPVLTVKQPWAELLVCGLKTVENRTWGVPHSVMGKRIAIHASKTFDRDAMFDGRVKKLLGMDEFDFMASAGRIIGTVVVAGEICMPPNSEQPGSCGIAPSKITKGDLSWWDGEEYFGWVLRRAKLFNIPRPLVRGRQGIWYWTPTLRICAKCGCTDEAACYDAHSGEPCHWVEENLCSACVHEEAL
jgi:hypothetical protein